MARITDKERLTQREKRIANVAFMFGQAERAQCGLTVNADAWPEYMEEAVYPLCLDAAIKKDTPKTPAGEKER